MPVVRFISLFANGQSDTQWFPRHLDRDHDHDDGDDDYEYIGGDIKYIGVNGADEENMSNSDDHTCYTSNVQEALPPQQKLFAPDVQN